MTRIRVAGPLFATAVFFGIRSWRPLDHGYFIPANQRDDAGGLFFTLAGVGAALALLFVAAGLTVLSRWWRRHGGFLVVSLMAILASLLPLLTLRWQGGQTWWPWLYLLHDYNGWVGAWLGFDGHSEAYAFSVQAVLAFVALVSIVAQIWTWSKPAPVDAGGPATLASQPIGAPLTHSRCAPVSRAVVRP